MDKNGSIKGQIKVFVLRCYALYLILVFLFISNFLETYHFKTWVNKPFIGFTFYFTRFAGHVLLTKQFTGNLQFRDYYWTYIALLLYFFIALFIAFVWTVTDKGKWIRQFFNYTWVFARYYLAAILLGYGISKLLGDQFGQPDNASLIRPLGGFDPRSLFWEFMGASKSYQVFGGSLEVIAGALLLFRRTTTLGSLIALSVFTNILMLDIAYDVFVKIRIVYFLLVVIFILIPDFKKLFKFFVLKQNTSLSDIPPVIEHRKFRRVHYISKVCFIGLIVFVIVRKQSEVYAQYHYPLQGSLSGVYEMSAFYLNGRLRQPGYNDTVGWRKIAINKYFPILGIQVSNDSVTDYFFKADTAKNFIDLTSYHEPGYKFRLYYEHTKADEWVFNGLFKNDSIRFVSKKIINKNFNLQNGYGKAIWDYDF